MRAAFALVVGLVLAGCAEPSVEGSDQSGIDPTATSPLVTSHSLSTHEEGSVALAARYRLAEDAVCDYGGAVRSMDGHRYEAYFWMDLVRHDIDGEANVDGSLPSGDVVFGVQANAASVDSRPLTHSTYQTFWDTIYGPSKLRTVASGSLDVLLTAGDYSLRIWTHDAYDHGGPRTNDGSLLIGIACERPFEVMATGIDHDPLFVTSLNATGNADAHGPLQAGATHEGERGWPAAPNPPSSCTFSLAQRGNAGTVSVDGPDAFEWRVLPNDNRNTYSYQDVAPGDHGVRWTLAGTALPFWVLAGGCFSDDGSSLASTPWSVPGA